MFIFLWLWPPQPCWVWRVRVCYVCFFLSPTPPRGHHSCTLISHAWPSLSSPQLIVLRCSIAHCRAQSREKRIFRLETRILWTFSRFLSRSVSFLEYFEVFIDFSVVRCVEVVRGCCEVLGFQWMSCCDALHTPHAVQADLQTLLAKVTCVSALGE